MPIVTFEVSVVTTLSNWSSTLATTLLIVPPAVVVPGAVVKATCVATSGLMTNGSELAGVKLALAGQQRIVAGNRERQPRHRGHAVDGAGAKGHGGAAPGPVPMEKLITDWSLATMVLVLSSTYTVTLLMPAPAVVRTGWTANTRWFAESSMRG